MRPDPSLFSLWHPVEVRFKDIDVGGHAHHSQVLVYFEEARARYWGEVVGKKGIADMDLILAEARVRYHGRILYPQRLGVGVRVSSLGRKHLVMEYLVRGENQEDLASGETTLVMYDYREGRSKPMPPEVGDSIRTWEANVA
jgi:acyl-CoA thioester hydrolase